MQPSDIPLINTRYQEHQQVETALALIDSGGSLTSVTIAPAIVPGGMMSPVATMTIFLQGTSSPELMKLVRERLAARGKDIVSELKKLGVDPSK